MSVSLEQQCISLELAKKLKELGVKQDSIFRWSLFNGESFGIRFMPIHLVEIAPFIDFTSAFNSDELMAIIPRFINTKKDEPYNNFRLKMTRGLIVREESGDLLSEEGGNIKAVEIFKIDYECDTFSLENIFPLSLFSKPIYAEKMPDALAMALIRLIEHKYVIVKND